MDKTDKRKKRTSINQYLMYIELLEKNLIFRSGTAPRDAEPNYINNTWKELAAKLNTCQNGPQLSPEEWKKRLNDWKNSTRCKYRRSLSGEKDISMSPLEKKALSLFGKTPVLVRSSQTLEFKSEARALYEAEKKHQEATKYKEEDQAYEEIEGIFIDDENDEYNDDESQDAVESDKKMTIVEATNGLASKAKRRRTIEATVFEIKQIQPKNVVSSTPRIVTSTANTTAESNGNPSETDQPAANQTANSSQNQIAFDTSAIEFQLKRIADIKAAKLQFEIAKYKYNNPGFEYTPEKL